MDALKRTVRRLARPRGGEVGRFDPDLSTESQRAGFAVSALFAGCPDPHLRLSEMDCVMVRDRSAVGLL